MARSNRTRRTTLAVAAAAAGLFVGLSAGPADAHHSAAMYDRNTQKLLKGEVKVWRFLNPHSFIDLTVVENGDPVTYSLEGQDVRVMTKGGFSRTSLKAGDKVTVLINPLRNGGKGGALLQVTRADGAVLTVRAPAAPGGR